MLPALPVAFRELRVAARRRTIYRLRFWAAVAATVLAAWMFAVMMRQPPASMSLTIFNSLASILLGFTLLAGSRATADSLSEEKRDGTLGLLFLTDLKGYDIVAGKMAASSMSCVYGLLATFPVLTIPLLMGGVSFGLVWRVVLILGNTLFFSLAAGMLASAWLRKERSAGGMAFLLVVLVNGGLPLAGAWFREYMLHVNNMPIPEFFMYPSAVVQYAMVVDHYSLSTGATTYSDSDFWGSLGIIHALGWLCLLFASWKAPRSWQDVPASVWTERWRARWQQWSYGNVQARAALRKELLDHNPFMWISGGRDRLQRALLWGFFYLLVIAYLYGAAKFQQDWFCAPVSIATALVFSSSLKFWLAGESTRRCLEIRRDGALELLVCTPMTVREMLRGQALALRRLFGGPLIAVGIVYLAMFVISLRDVHSDSDWLTLILSFLAGGIMLVVDYHALVWMGIWQGLSAKNAKTASGTTAWRILVLPWIVFGLSIPTWYFLLQTSGVRTEDPSPNALILWWMALGLATDYYHGFTAYRKLHQQYRSLAAERYQIPSKSWWQFYK